VKSDDISISEKRQVELRDLATRAIDLTDPDAPEVTVWDGAERGKFYRPLKQQITLRLDKDIIAWFKARGDKYQTRINEALREHVRRHNLTAERKRAIDGQITRAHDGHADATQDEITDLMSGQS
jgi:uncharacterized protein (DUF4415 family)